jgi:hypothetical protein
MPMRPRVHRCLQDIRNDSGFREQARPNPRDVVSLLSDKSCGALAHDSAMRKMTDLLRRVRWVGRRRRVSCTVPGSTRLRNVFIGDAYGFRLGTQRPGGRELVL